MNETPTARMYVAPAYVTPAAWIACLVAVAGFAASCWINGKHPGPRFDWEVGLLCGAMNPVFFILMPLSIYWMNLVSKSGLYELCPYCQDSTERTRGKSGEQHHCRRCNKVFLQS